MGWIDRLDDALTTAKGRHQARKEASQVGRNIELNRPYYTVEDLSPLGAPELPQRALKTWIFTKRNPITGVPMDGAVSAEGVYQRHGDLLPYKPSGLQTFDDLVGDPNATARAHSAQVRNPGKLKRAFNDLMNRRYRA